jgi:hypothetical protein
MNSSVEPTSVIFLILLEYDMMTIQNIIEVNMCNLYSKVFPLETLTGNEILASTLRWNDAPTYTHFDSTGETRYTSHYAHHSLIISVCTDSNGLLGIQFVIYPEPKTDVCETIAEEYEKIKTLVVLPIKEHIIAHGEHCQEVFEDLQTEFGCQQTTFLP